MLGKLALLLAGGAAAADPVRVEVRLMKEDAGGAPLAGLPVRIAVGSGEALRRAGAGRTHTADAGGRIAFDTDAVVTKRRITLDSIFFRHDAWFVEVGLELELVGRRALYVVALDMVRAGTVGVMTASLAGASGDFDSPLVFHPDTHSWSFPGDPGGWRLTDIGAKLVDHEMSGSAETGWTIRLGIARQEFTVR